MKDGGLALVSLGGGKHFAAEGRDLGIAGFEHMLRALELQVALAGLSRVLDAPTLFALPEQGKLGASVQPIPRSGQLWVRLYGPPEHPELLREFGLRVR